MSPERVVHVATIISTVQGIELTDTLHDELAERQLLPAEDVVDSGCISPARIERAQRVHGISGRIDTAATSADDTTPHTPSQAPQSPSRQRLTSIPSTVTALPLTTRYAIARDLRGMQ
ncbi:hypothetical protein [Streptomyces sp. NPDC003032]